MKILLQEITVAELVQGYADDQEQGIVGYGGKLDIRPPYQREFVYKDPQRDAVIDTVTKNFPLNVMYWAVRENGTYEVLDGQQRTLSICRFIDDNFSIACFDRTEKRTFLNLAEDEQERILNYKLQVYFCEGTDSEKLSWFERINIAGEKLAPQELRNAVYHGSWLADAKRYFSKNNCVAYHLANKYVNGSAIRQDYLETAIRWINNGNIEEYMSRHQHEKDALDLWTYFQCVIARIQEVPIFFIFGGSWSSNPYFLGLIKEQENKGKAAGLSSVTNGDLKNKGFMVWKVSLLAHDTLRN
jgi:hypothetical protein